MYVIAVCIYIALLIAVYRVTGLLYGIGIKSKTILGIAAMAVLLGGAKLAAAILDPIFFNKE